MELYNYQKQIISDFTGRVNYAYGVCLDLTSYGKLDQELFFSGARLDWPFHGATVKIRDGKGNEIAAVDSTGEIKRKP